MPVRDHFRPPQDDIASWEGFHGGWPMVIVQQLRKQLPPGYVAEPRVHSGSQVEIEVAAFEKDEHREPSAEGGRGGAATPVWTPPEPTQSEQRGHESRKGRLGSRYFCAGATGRLNRQIA